MGKLNDLTGLRFGRLAVLERAGSSKRKQAMWLCRCDCGAEMVTLGHSLVRGKTQSCGCYHKERVGKIAAKSNKKHGMCETRLYRIWHGMKTRCDNKNSRYYYLYGGEGKTVCKEWHDDFMAFYTWAMANGYRDDLTIERKDGTKGYSPDNCTWATMKEQANNRRKRRVEVKEL